MKSIPLLFFILSYFLFLLPADLMAQLSSTYVSISANETITISLDMNGHNESSVGLLKDLLLGYPEKVIHVQYNLKTNRLELTYNGHFSEQELRLSFREAGLPYPKS